VILLNGPPDIGKSTLARLYARNHALTLVLDIDSIRMSIGGWETTDESKGLARLLAVEMAYRALREAWHLPA
jgi:2-phosphoglycerate kinase